MKNKKIDPITKTRNLESTKKDLVFYITPSSFVLSYLRVFVVSPWVLFCILSPVFCLLSPVFFLLEK
jgi:hypothetical protein